MRTVTLTETEYRICAEALERYRKAKGAEKMLTVQHTKDKTTWPDVAAKYDSLLAHVKSAINKFAVCEAN